MSDWQLFLIRHAQSENNAKDESERVPDPGLTELGHQQAGFLVPFFQRLEPELVYCSPFLRTILTLKPSFAKSVRQPIIHPEIYEQGGCYAGHLVGQREPRPGMSRQQIADLCPGWIIPPEIPSSGWNRLKQYESISEARGRAERVRLWYESAETQHSVGRVAMMIHADFKIRLLEAFLEIPNLEAALSEPYNTSITWLVREKNRWRLRLWNDHSHLPLSHLSS